MNVTIRSVLLVDGFTSIYLTYLMFRILIFITVLSLLCISLLGLSRNKIPQKFISSQLWGLKSEIRVPAWLGCDETLFLACGCLPSRFVFTWKREQQRVRERTHMRESTLVSLLKAHESYCLRAPPV